MVDASDHSTSDQIEIGSWMQPLGNIFLWNIDLIGGDLTRGERCSFA